MAYNFEKLKASFSDTLDWLKNEISSLNTGRATPSIFDSILVESYNSKMPIKNIAAISVEDPKTLHIEPWDKGQIMAIEKAVNDANLGLSVRSDSEGLRVLFPELTEETRKKTVRHAKSKLEDARIRIRNIRDDIWSEIQNKENSGEISKDEKFKLKDEMQKNVDNINKQLEKIYTRKEKEILEI